MDNHVNFKSIRKHTISQQINIRGIRQRFNLPISTWHFYKIHPFFRNSQRALQKEQQSPYQTSKDAGGRRERNAFIARQRNHREEKRKEKKRRKKLQRKSNRVGKRQRMGIGKEPNGAAAAAAPRPQRRRWRKKAGREKKQKKQRQKKHPAKFTATAAPPRRPAPPGKESGNGLSSSTGGRP